MAPPSIYGDPKITQNEENGSVLLEVIVTGADPAKTKWFLGEKELAETDTYKFSNSDEGGKRHKFICEIKNFDKALAGEYKTKFFSGDGENFATFTVQQGNAPEFHEKPKIVQRDNGNVICIKVRAKSHLDMKVEWFKDGKPIKTTDRVKTVTKPDDKDKAGIQYRVPHNRFANYILATVAFSYFLNYYFYFITFLHTFGFL